MSLKILKCREAFAWLDQRGGGHTSWTGNNDDVYVQHVLASGAIDPGWPAEGRAVCTARYDQADLAPVLDGRGGVILTWRDNRHGKRTFLAEGGEEWEVYAQHVRADGRLGGDDAAPAPK